MVPGFTQAPLPSQVEAGWATAFEQVAAAQVFSG
jgi:hypothetical protein